MKQTKKCVYEQMENTISSSFRKSYTDLQEHSKVTTLTETGRRLVVNKYPKSNQIFLVKFYECGELSFPHGGIKIYNKTLDEYTLVYPEDAVLHERSDIFGFKSNS
jgi:hypothetical protein